MGTVLVQNVPFVIEAAVSVLIQIQNLGSKNMFLAIRNTFQCSERYMSKIYLFSFRHKKMETEACLVFRISPLGVKGT